MNEWIRVRDRLPEEKEPVIILLQDGQIFRGEIRMRQLLPEWWYYYDAGSSDIDILGLVYPIEKFEGIWFKGKPVIVVENRHVADIELLANEEVGEFWLFTE